MIPPEQRLLNAAGAGDLAALRSALAAGANVRDAEDLALRHAAECGHTAIVEALLAAGANLHAKDDEALRVAAERGHIATVKVLLEAGADVSAREDYPLRWASEHGHTEIVECLITAGANIHAIEDQALRSTAWAGHTPLVRLLRAHGAALTALPNDLDTYPENVQVALFAAGNVSDLSVTELAHQAICPAALCVLLERQGYAELAATLKATRMLESMAPEERAVVLLDLMTQSVQPEIIHAGP